MGWRHLPRGPSSRRRNPMPPYRQWHLPEKALAVSGEKDIGAVAREFQIGGKFVGATPYGSGHINDSYRATFYKAGTPVRYILQRINKPFSKTPAPSWKTSSG